MRQSLLTVNSCQWNSKGEETDFFVEMCSVRKKARLHIEEPPVTSNPLYMAEIIEKICTFLHPRDLKRCQRVNRTWYRVSTRELHFRKLALVSFRYGMSWINSSKAKSLFSKLEPILFKKRQHQARHQPAVRTSRIFGHLKLQFFVHFSWLYE